MFRKALTRWYFAQYLWNIISFTTYWAISSLFFLFYIKNLKSFVIQNFKGHNISLFRRAPSHLLPMYNVIQM